MCRGGLTRLPEDIGTFKKIHDQLQRVLAEYADLLEVKPHVLMPESAKANEFLDEVVTNGVMRRTGGALEFMHQSVRDYFAAVALLGETLESILTEVPVAAWVRPEDIRTVTNERRSRLHEAIVIYSGLREQSDELVAGLVDKDPLLAAESLAAGTVDEATKASFIETCLALLRSTDADSRFVGCSCVCASRRATDEVMEQLKTLLFSDEEWDGTRAEAIRAIAQSRSDTVVPVLLRTLQMPGAGALAHDVVLAITRYLYGEPDYALAVGLYMWHFYGSGSSAPVEQKEFGRKQREKLYELYCARSTPEELVDQVINPASESNLAALALLRLLHRSEAVDRFLDIIRERRRGYELAMLFVPQVDANDKIAAAVGRSWRIKKRRSPIDLMLRQPSLA